MAIGYFEEEHPTSFLDVMQSLEDLPEEGEVAEGGTSGSEAEHPPTPFVFRLNSWQSNRSGHSAYRKEEQNTNSSRYTSIVPPVPMEKLDRDARTTTKLQPAQPYDISSGTNYDINRTGVYQLSPARTYTPKFDTWL
ncbi:hypothetical protein F511_11993 [Dorcoceras hygrometricum]|uniref:Uncharacterized protein n=1 Tax=Dorcoceras hygrometricum TaxID=472368 RepID=A0A2Z7BXS7_9LAMI|nr:hypothetical protein F511_11993 [Dorcoceras hygrometricum]